MVKTMPIEYQGITHKTSHYFTNFDGVFPLSEEINIINIVKVHSSLKLLSELKIKKPLIYSGMIKISLNIEYVDGNNNDNISILHYFFYSPILFETKELIEFSPKIIDMFLKELDQKNLYISLSISPS